MQRSTDSLTPQTPPRFASLAVNAFFIVTVFYVFKDILFDTRVITSAGGDGTKNIYTYLYHILYEKGCWFYGMNYPYGEHVVFTDNQPLFSIPFSYLHQSLHFSAFGLLTFMFWMLAFSFWLGLNFTYRILLRFRVHYLLAAACSACIIVLSPQMFRLLGHYPLAFSSFLPMLFFYTMRYNDTSKGRYLVYLTLVSIVYALLHMYFLAMSLVWTTGYFIGFWLSRNEQVKHKWKHILLFVLNNVVAIGVLEAFVMLTDPIKDRPVIPYTPKADPVLGVLFTTKYSPFWQGISDIGFPGRINEGSEGGAYMGFAIMIMSVVGIVAWVKWRLKQRQGFHIPFPAVWVVLALVTLAFAMSISHVWDISFLKAILRPFRQFRVPERFSWVCYYVMSVYAAVALAHICGELYNKQKKALSYIVGFVVVSIWALEAIGKINALKVTTPQWKENYNTVFMKPGSNMAAFLGDHQLKNSDFSCIALIPHVYIGSEKLWIGEDHSATLNLAYATSLETGLPIMDVMMSRTSWGQTFKQVKFSAGLLAEKPVLELMKNDRILLMHYREYVLSPDDSAVINASDYIGDFRGTDMYSFYPGRLLKNRAMLCDSLKQIAKNQQTTDTVLGNKDQCLMEHFEQLRGPYTFAGAGAMRATIAQDSLLATWKLPAGIDSMRYEFSGWARFSAHDAGYCYFTLIFRDTAQNEIMRTDIIGGRSVDNDTGMWFRPAIFFRMPVKAATMDIHILHNGEDTYYALDELLLRPVNATVISKMKDGTVLANNHILVKGSDRK